MIDLDAPVPCGWCGGRIEWTHPPDDAVLYDGCCVSCGVVLPAYEAPWTWRELPKLAADCGEGGYHFRALIAEVERLRSELAAATARGAAEEREAVLEYLRRGPDWGLPASFPESPYYRWSRDARSVVAAFIEAGKHREETR